MTRAARSRRAACALLAAAACAGEAPPEPLRLGRVPVVVVVLDALDAGHLSHLGYERETTPEIDRLAAEGVTFVRALSPAPYTLAGIPSLLTGRHPDTHGLTRKTQRLDPAEVTLAELLRDAGYRTFGAAANVNGSGVFGLDQGFDTWVELFRAAEVPEPARDDARERDGMRLPDALDALPIFEGWLADLGEGDVPFLYVHLLEPHSPYDPPEPYRSRWLDPGYDGPLRSGDTEPLVASTRGELEVGPADVEAARALYDGNLAYADAAVGRLMDALRERGLYEESLVVVTSDHGEAFWQHGRWGHNDQLFEEMLRVPLVVKFPAGRGPRGRVVEGLASTIDLLPSVASWLGVAAPPGVEGVVLDGLLEGEVGRELFLRTNADFPTLGLRTNGAKTIVLRDPAGGARLGVEHYDLEADPAERRPLTDGEFPGGAERRDLVQRWARMRWEEANRRGGAESALTPEEEALLRELGYKD